MNTKNLKEGAVSAPMRAKSLVNAAQVLATRDISPKSNVDVCVFIGRFQPFHEGHAYVIEEGLRQSKRMIVLVGSDNEPRSTRNPFTTAERAAMITQTFNNHPNLVVAGLEDSAYNLNEWIERVYNTVNSLTKDLKTPTVALIGHAKDATSYYLNLFPMWQSINVPQKHTLSATSIRDQLFGNDALVDQVVASNSNKNLKMNEFVQSYVDAAHEQAKVYLSHQNELANIDHESHIPAQLNSNVIDMLTAFIDTDAYKNVTQEFAFVAKYRHAWKAAPYAPTFVTSDAVVIQSGHVLLVKRRGYPGKGLWALPGGFVEADESIEKSCLRELKEETGIKVPEAVLRGNIKAKEVFDAPFRSSRGRTITHAFLIHLDPGTLPKIKTGGLSGDEETEKIAWVPLASLNRSQFFEDHYAIIKNLTAHI